MNETFNKMFNRESQSYKLKQEQTRLLPCLATIYRNRRIIHFLSPPGHHERPKSVTSVPDGRIFIESKLNQSIQSVEIKVTLIRSKIEDAQILLAGWNWFSTRWIVSKVSTLWIFDALGIRRQKQAKWQQVKIRKIQKLVVVDEIAYSDNSVIKKANAIELKMVDVLCCLLNERTKLIWSSKPK